MTTHTKCTVSGRDVEFKLLSSGLISVGVSGLLVGNYSSPDDATFAAAEHVRVITGCDRRRPTIPAKTRRVVEAMHDVEATQ
jgi:hypothetical protein